MLPFPKRMKSDEIELGDEDIVLVEAADEAIAVDVVLDEVEIEVAPPPSARHRLPPVTPPPPKFSRPRLVSSPGFEDDVADQCLATIAAEASRARLSDSFPASIVPTPVRMPPSPPLPSFDDADVVQTARLPVVTAPPMVRAPVPYTRDSVPGLAAAPSGPAPAFVRTSSSSLPSVVPSVAPVAYSAAPEPTVIVVRQPPRTTWIVASALVGAACALAAMQLLPRANDARSAPPAPVAATPAPPPPAASPATPTPAATPAVVKFGDEQGLAIVAPVVSAAPAAAAPAPQPTHVAHAPVAPKPAAPPAPPPAVAAPAPAKAAPAKASSVGPKLPDGSVALGARVDPAPAPTNAASAPPPAPGTKKKLTPEQELAEAQLRASMK